MLNFKELNSLSPQTGVIYSLAASWRQSAANTIFGIYGTCINWH